MLYKISRSLRSLYYSFTLFSLTPFLPLVPVKERKSQARHEVLALLELLAVLIATWVTTGSGSSLAGFLWWVLHHAHIFQEIFSPFSGLPSNLPVVMCASRLTQPLLWYITTAEGHLPPPGSGVLWCSHLSACSAFHPRSPETPPLPHFSLFQLYSFLVTLSSEEVPADLLLPFKYSSA